MKTRTLGGVAIGMVLACGVVTAMGLARTTDDPSKTTPPGPANTNPAKADPAPDARPKPPAGARPGLRLPGTEPMYKALEDRAGDWDVEATFWLMPGAEGQTTRCTCTARMVLGGMYLEERLEGGEIGSGQGKIPFNTISHTGFDAGRKVFQVNRLSSTSPVMMPEEGTYNEETKALETKGEFEMVYMKLKVRTVGTRVSDDERLVEQYMSFNGAPEFKGIQLKMTRKK